jgi:thymidylate synthase ThyX
MSVENLKLEIKLLYPPLHVISETFLNSWLKELKSFVDEQTLSKVNQYIENLSSLRDGEQIIERFLHTYASKLRKKDGTVVSAEELNNFLRKDDPKITSEKRKHFKEQISTIDGKPFASSVFDEYIGKLSRVLNPLYVLLQPFNVEMPTIAAMYADTSFDSAHDILIGKGRSSPAGKPYYPLAAEVGFIPDRAKAGHKSLLSIPQFTFSIDGITRYGMFVLNSSYNCEWRDVEEKSGRDVPLNRIVVPPEYFQDREFERLANFVARNVNAAYEALDQIVGRTGKLIPNLEDGRYITILAARTATSLSMNFHNFVELATAVECNEKEVAELKILYNLLKEELKPIAPTLAESATDIGRALEYALPKPGLEEHFDVNALISWFNQTGKNAKLLKLSFTGEKIPEIRGLADEGLKSIYCEYVVRGSLSFAAQQMRHNWSWQSWLSLDYIPQYWSEDMQFVTVPPSFEKKERAMEIFRHAVGETRDFVLSNSSTKKPFFYAYPLVLHTVGAFRMDGFGLMNYLNQRVSPHAQWEIRQIARELHNQIISDAALGDAFYEIMQATSYRKLLEDAVNKDEAFYKNGKIYFAV